MHPLKRLIMVGITAVFLCVCGIYSIFPHVKLCVAASSWVEGKAECVMEANSRRILYQSKGDLRLPMASTTKILTAITVIENCRDIQGAVEIPQEAEGVEGSSVYLKSGDHYTVEELLYGLMLRSGNDCATALAIAQSGNIKDFSSKMNETAQKAGALNSHFKNPHGLPCKGHYTTAIDLTSITCYAMQNAFFRKIVATRYFEPRNWRNKNKLLSQYDGAIGVKTGYTLEAGRCLVAAAEREGMTLVCTLLSCPTTYERAVCLLDDGFSAYQYREILPKDKVYTLQNGERRIDGYIKESFYYPILEEEASVIEICINAIDAANEKKSNEIIGQIEIYLTKQLIFSTNLYKL